MSDEAELINQLRSKAAALEQLLEVQERVVAEQSQHLEEKTIDLQRSNRALEQFAYVISHDLQEPLRMVASYTELLAERYRGKLDERADRYINFASGAARRMQDMINALLDFSRVTSRGKEMVAVDLQSVVSDALSNLSLAIERSKAEVHRDVSGIVHGDRSQLIQLLQNLIANALKFQRDSVPPQVYVSSSRVGGDILLKVADNGIGIDKRFQERIFEIFERLEPKRFEGTGIGLSICQRIAERHGGKIWVESELGKGSTFFVTLRAMENK